VPLRRGADGSLGVASAGAGGKAPTIVINNHTDAQPQVSASLNGDVTVTLRKTLDAMVGDSMSTGTGRRVLA
jgi:phage-related minor tail protein